MEISSGKEMETRSLIPSRPKTAARKAKGADFRSKPTAVGLQVVSVHNLARSLRETYHAHRFAHNED